MGCITCSGCGWFSEAAAPEPPSWMVSSLPLTRNKGNVRAKIRFILNDINSNWMYHLIMMEMGLAYDPIKAPVIDEHVMALNNKQRKC
jgi:hypothetical protein